MGTRCFTGSPSGVLISPACPGSRSRLAASNRVGSTVPSQGAVTARKTKNKSAAPPRRTDQLARMWLIADPRVEEHVGQVDQQVDRHIQEGEEQDQPLG